MWEGKRAIDDREAAEGEGLCCRCATVTVLLLEDVTVLEVSPFDSREILLHALDRQALKSPTCHCMFLKDMPTQLRNSPGPLAKGVRDLPARSTIESCVPARSTIESCVSPPETSPSLPTHRALKRPRAPPEICRVWEIDTQKRYH